MIAYLKDYLSPCMHRLICILAPDQHASIRVDGLTKQDQLVEILHSS